LAGDLCGLSDEPGVVAIDQRPLEFIELAAFLPKIPRNALLTIHKAAPTLSH
jgi:hypothetical protein